MTLTEQQKFDRDKQVKGIVKAIKKFDQELQSTRTHEVEGLVKEYYFPWSSAEHTENILRISYKDENGNECSIEYRKRIK